MGEIIKILMITASGSEGINLRNTRYVHIMEPYWHPVRTEQVIGRARRICSHQELPERLQTLEVFIYLMTFTQEQKETVISIELKLKDLSKIDRKTPLTSDEALYEISVIKERVSGQLLKSIKEASIDCAIHSKSGSKEGLHCLQFTDPTKTAFSYKPNYGSDNKDVVANLNKRKIEWTGKEINIPGRGRDGDDRFIAREMGRNKYNIYDYESYMAALDNPSVDPILLFELEYQADGNAIIRNL